MTAIKHGSGALVGLAAAAAFGAFALTSAPAARADAFSDILADVQADDVAGQADYSAALADFTGGSSGVPDGLQAFFTGLDNEEVLAPDQVLIGTVQALQNQPVSDLPPLDIGTPPVDLADALTSAQAEFSSGEVYFSLAATALSSGDWTTAVYEDLNGLFSVFDNPAETIFIGAAESLLGI